ncbi:Uncharacterised protein [Candidatus Venteria ishoeyi]|nr:Uncharacterised protein [Candidatus Venteria ishoeyi]
MVERAEDYLWSSAAAHCGLRDDALLTTDSIHCKVFEDISDYSAWLGEDDNDTQLNIMRRNIQKNLPCGSNPFIEQLERISGRILSFRPIGRPKKAIKG